MNLYLDTSAVVSLLASEPASPRLTSWLRTNGAAGLAISPWVATEVASAFSLKIRTGELTLDERADALTEWRRMRESNLIVLAIPETAFQVAADFAARHELGLRAGDALHLAIASAHGCTLVTLDEHMAKAAPEVGVPLAKV